MSGIPDSLNDLIEQFSKLPGIGKKSAERMAIYILRDSVNSANNLSLSILNVKNNITIDEVSQCFMENGITINDNNERNAETLCVVKDPVEVFLIEKSGYKGHYHVLGGLISPLDGVSPDDLNIDNLIKIVNNYNEIIIALDPNSEGDTTTLYLIDILKEFNVKTSRLARGIPVGSSFDYVDEITLSHSIEDRIEIK